MSAPQLTLQVDNISENHKLNHEFSYATYIELIDKLRKRVPILDFSDVTSDTKKFLVLRHDVEFSIEKAHTLAKVEHDELNICSSFFFQIRNNFYNTFSDRNIKLIKEIEDMGHKIGLHVHPSAMEDSRDISTHIQNDAEVLSYFLNIKIDRYSFHRPSKFILSLNLSIPGLINTYHDRYFHFYEAVRPNFLKVYYAADSDHKWKYFNLNELLQRGAHKMQILTHPYSWSLSGLNSDAAFFELIKQKNIELIQTISDECDHYPKELKNNGKI